MHVTFFDKQYNCFLVGFEPIASMSVVHHMLVFGCTTPGQSEETWDCGEMASFSLNSRLKQANPCEEGSHVIEFKKSYVFQKRKCSHYYFR